VVRRSSGRLGSNRAGATLVGLVTLSLLAACGSDGTVAQPEDDFLDKVEAECRAAQKDVDKLDFSATDSGAVDRFVDIVSGLVETFKDFEPPDSLSKDFRNLTDRLDDQAAGAQRVSDAINTGDQAAIDEENSTSFDLAAETDKSANALGALRCTALAPFDGLVVTAGSVDSVPAETIPIDTTPVTEPPVTDSVDTTTVDTTPVTEPAVYPNDLDVIAQPPAGYTWVEDYVQTDVSGLYGTSVLGPLVVDYSAGQVESVDDGHTASIYVLTISSEWTDEAIDQYLTWEVVADGEDLVTPAGYPVRRMVLAFEDVDCLAYYANTTGIAVCTFTGIDGMPILDAFIAANPG
jgi:predicted small lipoprotein YifL